MHLQVNIESPDQAEQEHKLWKEQLFEKCNYQGSCEVSNYQSSQRAGKYVIADH